MTDAPDSNAAADPNAAAAAAAAAADPNAGASWRDSLPDELKADATLGKYDSIEAFARGHLETKRQLSADKIVLPKGDDDADGWSNLFDALGRPKDPAEYTFPTLKEGETSELADAFRPIAHELGLNQRQVGKLDEFLTNAVQGIADQQAEATRTADAAEIDALKSEVGEDGFKAMSTRAAAAAKAFGVAGSEGVDKLNDILGSAALVKMFDDIGRKMGEGTLRLGEAAPIDVGGDPIKIREELTNDKDFTKKLLDGDVAAKRRWEAVQAAVAAKQQAA